MKNVSTYLEKYTYVYTNFVETKLYDYNTYMINLQNVLNV